MFGNISLKTIARVCYVMAGTLGVAALGMHYSAARKKFLGFIPRPASSSGVLTLMTAFVVGMTGKTLEEIEHAQVSTLSTFGAFTPRHAQTLRSAFDRGDQYLDQAIGDQRAPRAGR